jgi:hypothetical protein
MIKKFALRERWQMKRFLCLSLMSTELGKGGVGAHRKGLELGQKRAFLMEERGTSTCKGRVAWKSLCIGRRATTLIRLEYKTGGRPARCPVL